MKALLGCSTNRRERLHRFHASSFGSGCSGATCHDASETSRSLVSPRGTEPRKGN
jgi:hypothetical protein